jgi:hypothetical protein
LQDFGCLQIKGNNRINHSQCQALYVTDKHAVYL